MGQSHSPELDKIGIPRGRDGLGREIKGSGIWVDEVMGGRHSREGIVWHAGTKRGWETRRGLHLEINRQSALSTLISK